MILNFLVSALRALHMISSRYDCFRLSIVIRDKPLVGS